MFLDFWLNKIPEIGLKEKQSTAVLNNQSARMHFIKSL